MKPSILVVMLDFLVCSLLLFVIGTGGQQTQFATSAPTPARAVAEEYSPAALQTQQEEWNRDYEQQSLLTELNTQTSENQQLRARLNETSATLAAREANLKALAEEKARVEQAKSQTEQALTSVEANLTRVTAERQKLQQEGQATKESLAKVQTELTGLQTEQAKLQQERSELRQRAQQLDQTVSSQQATISTLSEEVRASQARVEGQLTDVARGQQQMGTTLAQLDEFTRTLPAAIQQSVSSVHDEQATMQQDVAALAENVKELQAGLSAEERTRLMQAVTDVAKGQQQLQSRLEDLIKGGQGTQIGQSLTTIQAGQDALQQQTARLAEQIESIKSRGPGPYKAVKSARLELAVSMLKRDDRDATVSRFKTTAYPPVVQVGEQAYVVTEYRSLGLGWWGVGAGSGSEGGLTEFKCNISRVGPTPWTAPVTATACGLRADPRVVSIPVAQLPPEVKTMELIGPEALLQSGLQKFYIFKSTAAGLSFEVETSPDLADARYLVIKRALRGVAAWFENPAYRADAGDYMVTPDGKLVGIMIDRERCLVLSKNSLQDCAATVPLADRQQFLRAAGQYPRIR